MKCFTAQILLCFTFIILSISSIHAQIAHTEDTLVQKKVRQNIFKRTSQDALLTGETILASYKRPFSWKKKEWLLFSGTLVTVGAASCLDRPVYRYMQNNQTRLKNKFASFGDFMGQPENNYPFMLGLITVGEVINNEWMRDTGIMLVASVTASGVLQTIAKTVVGRSRPSRGEEFSRNFRPFKSLPGSHSFPSGHSMLALSVHWILARQTNFIPLKIVFYSVPAIVSWSRVYDNAHWFSDILLGNALGIAFGEAVLHIYPKLKERKNLKGLGLTTTSNGLGLQYKF